MKLVQDRPYADPEKAARRLMEHARAFEPVEDGRVYIEVINSKFLIGDKATADEYLAGLEFAKTQKWLEEHESGTYVKILQAGADMLG